MKIEIDTDFALPLFITFMIIIFVITYQTLVPKSHIEDLVIENNELFVEVSSANHEINGLTKELNKYKITEESLRRLGASQLEAQRAMMASEVYGLDPKPMGAL